MILLTAVTSAFAVATAIAASIILGMLLWLLLAWLADKYDAWRTDNWKGW
jgi:hypothetical protein